MPRKGTSNEMLDTEARYTKLASTLLKVQSVSRSEKKGFGSGALFVKGKIFAMLEHNKLLVLKLPKNRVDELVALGYGEKFNPRQKGKPMNEWLVVAPESKADWITLAKEALEFVSGPGQLR